MTISRQVLQRIEHNVSGTRLCRDMLAVVPMEHIIRGFLFEKATEKDMYFLWQVIMPLYRPSNTIVLNYSSRIPDGTWKFHLSKERIAEVSEQVRQVIHDGHLEHLRTVRRPSDFLDHISWMIGNTTVTFRIDLALTHYLLGNADQCLRILKALPVESKITTRLHADLVTTLVQALEEDPATVTPRIERWEGKNVERLGLAPVIDTASRRFRLHRNVK